MESSLTSFLVSGTSFFGREAVRPAMKSRDVPRRIKIGRRTVLKVYCSGREASKLQEAVCCQFLQGSVELLEIV